MYHFPSEMVFIYILISFSYLSTLYIEVMYMDDILKLIGERLKIIRKARGLTQEELAEKADLQHTLIGLAERGERNISLLTLQKILNGLEISPVSLFNYEDIEEMNNVLNEDRLLGKYKALIKNRSYDEKELIFKLASEIFKYNDSKKML